MASLAPIWICNSRSTGIERLIVIGLIAHTCIEATVRFAAELGYDVTVVRDATADYSDEAMHAALVVNMPNYASVVTTKEVVDSDLIALGLGSRYAPEAAISSLDFPAGLAVTGPITKRTAFSQML